MIRVTIERMVTNDESIALGVMLLDEQRANGNECTYAAVVSTLGGDGYALRNGHCRHAASENVWRLVAKALESTGYRA